VRFQRLQRYPFVDTPRKRAAYKVKCRREQEALPLFAELIAEEQDDVEAVMKRRREAWEAQQVEARAHRAAKWREARATLRGHIDGPAILARWQSLSIPADPPYLLTLILSWDRGAEWARG